MRYDRRFDRRPRTVGRRTLRQRLQRVAGGLGLVSLALASGVSVASGAGLVPSALAGMRLFVSDDSPARRQAEAWRRSRPADARLMERIAAQPLAEWFGGWNGNVRADVERLATRAGVGGAVPVMVAYNIPGRDCGSHSAGGERDAGAYRKWISAFAAGLGGRRAIVVLEPDALAQVDCLDGKRREERFAMLRDAVATLKAKGAVVYLDAGHGRWHGADVMAERLRKAGIDRADGFALNVSNFVATDANVAFGEALSRRVGGKHFVIDTSRNGVGGTADNAWCNAAGQGLGAAPTTQTGHALVDAYLWVKRPGESDGSCNGGPRAGEWWADYALGLAKRART